MPDNTFTNQIYYTFPESTEDRYTVWKAEYSPFVPMKQKPENPIKRISREYYEAAQELLKGDELLLRLARHLLGVTVEPYEFGAMYNQNRMIDRFQNFLRENVSKAWSSNEITNLTRIWVTHDWERSSTLIKDGTAEVVIDFQQVDFKRFGYWMWVLAGSFEFDKVHNVWQIVVSAGNKSVYIGENIDLLMSLIKYKFHPSRMTIESKELIQIGDPDKIFDEAIADSKDSGTDYVIYLGGRYLSPKYTRAVYYGERYDE